MFKRLARWIVLLLERPAIERQEKIILDLETDKRKLEATIEAQKVQINQLVAVTVRDRKRVEAESAIYSAKEAQARLGNAH